MILNWKCNMYIELEMLHWYPVYDTELEILLGTQFMILN